MNVFSGISSPVSSRIKYHKTDCFLVVVTSSCDMMEKRFCIPFDKSGLLPRHTSQPVTDRYTEETKIKTKNQL